MPPRLTAIVGATAIDGTGSAPVDDATVLIEGERIRSIAPAADIAGIFATTLRLLLAGAVSAGDG
jgi:hypothetical protein